MTTTIEWTDETWNPVRGCSLVSKGCESCYAMRQAHRFSGKGQPYEGLTEWGPHGPRWTGKVRLVPEVLEEPLHWKKPRRIFVNSMSDLFHEDVPEEFVIAIFAVMMACPQHTFQILTKRPQRMRVYLLGLQILGGLGPYIRSIRIDGDRTIPKLFDAVARTEVVRGRRCRAVDDPWMAVFNAAACWMSDRPLPNVWIGVSVEDQQTADERIPILLQTPAAVRFVSYEPALGAVDLRAWIPPHTDGLCSHEHCGPPPELDWLIVGGESGPGARPCNVAWIRSVVQQCGAAGVPVFVKQLGARPVEYCCDGQHPNMELNDPKGGDPSEWPSDLRVREWPI